ncbi:hypothetical protein, partial [uncultured Pantoea sp.]|uniref:hypothetical protein n=1 Tax=uncultured Pantoea sp. TaxID=218084 RepID=UPI00258F64FA
SRRLSSWLSGSELRVEKAVTGAASEAEGVGHYCAASLAESTPDGNGNLDGKRDETILIRGLRN